MGTRYGSRGSRDSPELIQRFIVADGRQLERRLGIAIVHAAGAKAPVREGSKAKGAPFAPAGLTAGSRALNSAFIRDSIVRQSMLSVPGLAKAGVMGEEDRQALEGRQQQARQLRQRTLTAGNARDLVVLEGKGKDGVGAVGGPGVGSITAPLFSSGPSAAQ